MKHSRNGWLGKSFWAAAMAVIVLLSGCAHDLQESRRFDRISGPLERGGTVYGVFSSNAELVGGIDRTLAQLESYLSTAKFSETEKQAAWQRIAVVQLWKRLLGFQDIEGIGASSVKRAGGIFSNRLFLATSPQFDGMINRIFRREQSDIVPVLGNLPQETFLAAGADISGKNILLWLSGAGAFGERVIQSFPAGLPVEVFANIEGWLVFALARDPVLPPEDNCFMFQIPDPEGKVFALASVIFNQGKNAVVSTRIVLPLEDGTLYLNRPVLKKVDGKLIVYSSARAEELFEQRRGGNLKARPDFVRYAQNLSASGSCFIYSRRVQVPGSDFIRSVPGAELVLPDGGCSTFGVLSRTENGWLWQENSEKELSAIVGENGVFQMLSKWILPEPKPKNAGKGSSGNESAPAKPIADRCPKALEKLYSDLLKYAREHQEKFPEFAGIKSLKQVFPKWRNPVGCRIFYFGSPDKSANYPLAISCHVKAKDSFCVLYADGTVRSYKLERAGSCRRIISFLYTVHRWEAKLFQHLIKQAQQLDEESAKKE